MLHPVPAREPIVSFRHVRKAFGPKVIYTDLSLDLHRGETVTIMGASGSGKSVMLKMLIGLLTPDSGELLFDGQDVTKMDDEKLGLVRRRVAYLFQGAALFDSLSVGENVAYGLREQFWNTMTNEEIGARVEQSLGLVGLPGIEGMRPSDLSGGMRKRVGLARTSPCSPRSSCTTSRRRASTPSTPRASTISSTASSAPSSSRASSSPTTWAPPSPSRTAWR